MDVPSGSREFGSGMDPRRLFSGSPLRNRQPPNAIDGYLQISPLKTEPVVFSPFKESNLSPFKLIGQSPSKGSYDEWDKDFINSFEENLFGIGDSPEGLTEELLKSPKGKALMNRMSSPLKPSNNSSVPKIRISPLRRQPSTGFQPISTGFTIGNGIGQDLIQVGVVKTEEVQDDHLYGQPAGSTDTWCAVDSNIVSATDTPMKPIPTSVGNAPNRRLAIETPGHFTQVPVVILQKENYLPQHVRFQETWPSKERLKFARAQLTTVLNGIVERELERKRAVKQEPGLIDASEEPDTRSNIPPKSSSGKHGSKSKGKVSKKAKKKEKYPEISMALSKPAASKRVVDVHKRSVSGGHEVARYDPGWLPDEMMEEEPDDVWTGPLPFDSLGSSGFQGDEDSDEDWSFEFETVSGRRLNHAKRKKRF